MAEEKNNHDDSFVNFFLQNPMPMLIYDLETLEFLAVNKAAVKYFDYSEQEFLAMTIKEICVQEDIPKFLKNIPEVASGRDTADDWRHVKKSGSEIHGETVTHPITYKGRKAGYVIIKNLTTIKIAVKELKDNIKLLHFTLKETIRVVAMIIESRSAYLAFHQRRTAELVRAITSEMNLPAEQAEGIEMAALIHDLGEVAVPAEILNRSGILNEIERSLIKTHPQVGYESLKDINFPWPIAEIILQHHERLDGSGYPHGLKGEDILLEARILGLAEAVEAMCSHRPYRAALPVSEVLENITQGRGTIFDAKVVDACITLFKEKNFEFSL